MTWALPWLGKDKTIFRAGYSIAYERFTQVSVRSTLGLQRSGT